MKFTMSHQKHDKKLSRQSELAQIQEDRKHILSPNSNFFIREAYKTLRTNLLFSLTEQKKCHTVMVTSSHQQEGKSTTSLNLAISLAEAEKKVVIIDCDLRKPKLARLLGTSSASGLSNILMNSQLLSEAIIHQPDLHIDAILSGDIPPNPSELLGSDRMSQLLDTLGTAYDYIILDTPPINVVTDSAVVAPKTDGTVVVVRANQTDRGDVIHAVSQLEYAHAKILGFVLNGIDMDQSGRGYKKYTRYQSYGYEAYETDSSSSDADASVK